MDHILLESNTIDHCISGNSILTVVSVQAKTLMRGRDFGYIQTTFIFQILRIMLKSPEQMFKT